ncbi:MAG: hypothetical protein O7G87_10110, partial [bacterium]|nr:hypothetical protein [bacterium]
MLSFRLFRLVFLVSCLAFTLPLGGQSASLNPDFDADGTVGFGDFILFAQHFGTRQGDANYNARFDLDGSGDVGFSDFLSFTQAFGQEVENTPPTRTEATLDAASGGTVSLSEGPEIQIPTGSLSGNVTVRIERIGSIPIERKPPDALTIGDLFDIQVEGGTIIGPIGLAIPYDPTKLPSGADLSSVFAAFWDGQNWHRVPDIVDPETQQIWIETNHLSEWTGLFGKTLQIKRFSALPEKLVTPPTQVQIIDFALTADTRRLAAEALDVTLSFETQVNNIFTPSGQLTLQDDGNPQGGPSELEIIAPDNNPLFNFFVHSTDPTASGDGVYGAQLSLLADPLLEHVQAIRATVTIKKRTGSGTTLDQREILIPIEKTQERLAIRLVSPTSGETVDPNPIFTWEANFFQTDGGGTPADRVTVFIDDDPNLYSEFFNPSGFQRRVITITGNNWLQIREALPRGDYYWGIEAFHNATRQSQRTQTPTPFKVSGVEFYTDNLPEVDPRDHLPKITIDPLEGAQTGNITWTYTLEDEDQNANNLVFTFTSSLQNGSAHLVSTTNGTVVDPGRGRYVIQAVLPGTHSVVWNSRNGLDEKLVRDVRIHVSPGDDLDRGPRLASSSAFVVDNT